MEAVQAPREVLRDLGPNWFAPVMGTGIMANGAALLPVHVAAVRARRHIHEPAMAPFYGAPPLALLTVGAGALLVGRDIVGPVCSSR